MQRLVVFCIHGKTIIKFLRYCFLLVFYKAGSESLKRNGAKQIRIPNTVEKNLVFSLPSRKQVSFVRQ